MDKLVRSQGIEEIMNLKRLLSAIMSISLIIVSTIVLAVDESSVVYEDAISICSYENGVCTIGGVVCPNSEITLEVEMTNGSFGNFTTDTVFAAKVKNYLAYFKQVTSDSNGKYNVTWQWKPNEISDGTYGVRVYSALDHKEYFSELTIGKADLALYSVEHCGINDEGEELRNGTKFKIKANVSELNGASGSACVLISRFAKDTGELLGVDIDYGIAKGNATTEFTEYVDLAPGQDDTFKVFVWDSETGMRPLGKGAEFSADEVYTAPSGEQVYNDLITHMGGKQVHPRINATTDKISEVKAKMDSGTFDYYNARFNRWISYCDDCPDCTYDKADGIRISQACYYFGYKMSTYGLCAWLNKDDNSELAKEYFDKSWTQIENVSDFPDWNPSHFLDTGMMARSYAEAFDYFYDYLTDDEKQLMIDTAIEKAFEPALEDYNNTSQSRTFYWCRPSNTNNWNLVCNGGIIELALAMIDEPTAHDICIEILDAAMESVADGLGLYNDGEWAETLTYWAYATDYLSTLDNALDNSCGTDYGMYTVKGLEDTFDYVISLVGSSSNIFNFGEGDSSFSGTAELYYLPTKYGKKNFETFMNWQCMYDGDKRGTFARAYTMLFYDGNAEGMIKDYPLQMFALNTGVAVMRGDTSNAYFSGFNGNSTMSVCLKTGDNSASHSQLDKGSFILDYECARYVWDIGKDNNSYSPPAGVSKWDYYLNRAEGNNTLVINPTTGPDQDLDAYCPITNYGYDDEHAFVITDLTDAYDSNAYSVKRGITLTENRTVTIVRDEMSLKKPSDVYWQAHFKDMTSSGYPPIISEDGKKVWIMMAYHGYKWMEFKIIDGPNDAKFEIMSATPFIENSAIDNVSTSGYKKLVIHLSNYSGGTLEVGITGTAKNEDHAFTSLGALDDWN